MSSVLVALTWEHIMQGSETAAPKLGPKQANMQPARHDAMILQNQCNLLLDNPYT